MTGDQITVAELLARKKAAGEEAAAAEKTRRERRRHRNIDDGGVSVAELTGSIPVVRDEDDDAAKPSSHSQNQETKAEPKAAPKPEAKVKTTIEPKSEENTDSKTGTVAAETKSAEKTESKTPITKVSVPKPAIENQVPGLGKSAKTAAVGAKPEAKTTTKGSDALAQETSVARSSAKPAKPEPGSKNVSAAAKSGAKIAESKAADTSEAKAVPKKQPPKTAAEAEPATAAQPAPKSTETKGSSTLAEQAAAVASQKHDPQVTPEGVTKDLTQSTKAAVAKPEAQEAVVSAKAGIKKPASKPEENTPDNTKTTVLRAPQAAASAVASTQAASEATVSVSPDIATNGAQSAVKAEQEAPAEADVQAVRADDHEDEGHISIPILILEIILALAVGAGIFMGFEVLWERFSTIITGALALIVTGVVVGVVHALLKKRDALILVLAAIVGLALTFGPMLITNI